VLAWAFGTGDVPERFAGDMMEAMKRLDYVDIPR